MLRFSKYGGGRCVCDDQTYGNLLEVCVTRYIPITSQQSQRDNAFTVAAFVTILSQSSAAKHPRPPK